MRFKTILAGFALAVSAMALAGDVQSFTAPGVELGKYKTFKMLPTRVLTKSGIQENDPTYGPYITASVREERKRKA